jgi:hypothetical protein
VFSRRMRPAFLLLALCALLFGCASIQNAPINQPGSAGPSDRSHFNLDENGEIDDNVVGLSFSGGGTRAAAFSFGVLTEMEQTRLHGGRASMLDHLDFISGVSGGSVTAAYYGLRKRAGLADFRERFLLRNAEEGLRTDLTLGTIGRALRAGSMPICSMARPSVIFARPGDRKSGSTPPTSITAPRSCSARPRSTRCAAISRNIRWRMRWQRPPRCRSPSRRW